MIPVPSWPGQLPRCHLAATNTVQGPAVPDSVETFWTQLFFLLKK